MNNFNNILSGVVNSVDILASKVADIKSSTSGVITTIETKRLTEDGNTELNTIDNVSVVANGQIITKFFSAAESINPITTFIDKEVFTFFDELGMTPTTYNGFEWSEEEYPLSGMTAENGPYLVFCTKTAEDAAQPSPHLSLGQFHVKSIKGIFDSAINEIVDTKLETVNNQLSGIITQLEELQAKVN